MGGLKAEYNHKEENKMAKKSKKYVEALNKIDRTRLYDATEALSLVAEVATAKFDETVEAHIKLGVDSRHADQQVRGAIVLPHGTGKTKKVLVFAKGEKAKEAEAAGADYLGSGAVFGTSTKADAKPMELDLFQEICESVTIPVVAIGGINADNVLRLKGRKMAGTAVVSGIFACEDIEKGTRELLEKVESII